jgi:hypothetical protein
MSVVLGEPQFIAPSVMAAPRLTVRLSWSPLRAEISWRKPKVIFGTVGQVIPAPEAFTLVGGESLTLVGGEPIETTPYTPIY